MPTSIHLQITRNHLALSLSPGPWLIDTGCDVSFGEAPILHLSDATHHVPPSYGGVSAETLNAYTKGSFVGLVGNDVLGKYDVEFNLRSHYAEFSPDPIHSLQGAKVPLGRVAGTHTPTLLAAVGTSGSRRPIFDTGAQYSFLENLDGLGARPVGQGEDFHVSCGRFKVDLHEVTMTVGSITAPITFATEPGKLTCPPAVGALLKATGTQGILGWEILKHGPMAFLPRRGELWI